MAQLVLKEIPTGAIDGVNKVYTTSKDIIAVTDLFIDGAEYFDYTFSGKEITLVDAPTLSVYVDYLSAGVSPVPTFNVVTLAEIKTKTWQEMVQNSSSKTYSSDRLRDMINRVSREILELKVYNDLTQGYAQGSGFYFNTDKFGIEVLESIPLTADIAVTDTEISLDTSTLSDSGAVIIGDDLIEYTAKTATQITGVTGILVSHKTGELAEPVYQCSDFFDKPITMYKVVQGRKLFVNHIDEDNFQLRQYYDVVYSDLNKYIKVYGLEKGTYYMEYSKIYEELVNDSDYSVLPYDIALNVVPFIVGGRLIKDEVLRVQLLNEGFGQLGKEFDKYNNKLNTPKKITWTRFGFNSVKPGYGGRTYR